MLRYRLCFIFLFSCLFITQTIRYNPVDAYDACYVCGKSSYRVANPSAIIAIPEEFWFLGEKEASCRDIERWGLKGSFPPYVCSRLKTSDYYTHCRCQLTRMPTTAPVPRLSSVPKTAPTIAPIVPPVIITIPEEPTIADSNCYIRFLSFKGCGIFLRILGLCNPK